MIDYSFMDKQIATEIIDGIIVAIYPQLSETLQTVRLSPSNIVQNKDDRRIVLTRLAIVLKNKLQKDIEEQMLIYKLFGITPPEEYKQIKKLTAT